jgi:hypothetical protein
VSGEDVPSVQLLYIVWVKGRDSVPGLIQIVASSHSSSGTSSGLRLKLRM